ncbi:hypothetical protein P153DRAFT_432769 [Dothidotthia symphoricarpi CBS 119687]|uniref:Uncharacterized protein n=1 Tax=Dothidotthia symphoricarpi CBS 119687 TaxID=1392245 RepID=A0A6A6AA00_9PLEO|nr:uncharacterized protein P153DRAFT_432769 [Dothidotthia symphoricarpi CBS 119687]KAF2127688.1 hypothetical protein P153DRAFT_432769 [Dothidotthia symphoricarpi CBS 119687]
MKSTQDIIARQSRPQRNSTWTPRTRDWRYATGVFQHDDFNDTPRDRSVWDTLDLDHQVDDRKRDRNGVAGNLERHGTMSPENAPKRRKTEHASDSANTVSPRDSVSSSVVTYEHIQTTKLGDGVSSYSPVKLIVKLRFTGGNIVAMQHIVNNEAYLPPTPAQTPASKKLYAIDSPVIARTNYVPDMPDSPRSNRANSLYQRPWVDETLDFNMKTVRSTLQEANTQIERPGATENWYPSAVPIDAIFPPGVPLSAKEILAFYPHHTFFRGPPPTPPLLPSTLPSSRPTHTLHTTHLTPPHPQTTIPTLSALLNGLKNLPSGPSARDLTHVLTWYQCIRATFHPPLDLNVLHTQALVRALRRPLRSYGPQNLDRIALEEWRGGGFVECAVVRRGEVGVEDEGKGDGERRKQSCVEVDLLREEVRAHVVLPVRHVLLFPFVAVQGLVGEALRRGVERAEGRREGRREEVRQKEGRKDQTVGAGDTHRVGGCYGTPKRPIPPPRNEFPPTPETTPRRAEVRTAAPWTPVRPFVYARR